MTLLPPGVGSRVRAALPVRAKLKQASTSPGECRWGQSQDKRPVPAATRGRAGSNCPGAGLPVVPAAAARPGDRFSDTQDKAKQEYDQRGEREPPQDMNGKPETAQDKNDQQGYQDNGHGTTSPFPS